MQGISQCPRRSVLTQLWFWVLVAIGAGTLFGIVAPEHAKEAKWLADAFLQLVKTITAPVIFITVVVGIASLGNMARAGGLAARALGYFFGATVVALGLGLLAGNLLHPGGGFAGGRRRPPAKLERYARYRAGVEGAAEPTQAEVDALLGTLRGSAEPALPKGLNPTTLDHVRSALRDAGEPLTASEVAGRCGLSHVTARRYLEHLAVEGAVDLSMRCFDPPRALRSDVCSAPSWSPRLRRAGRSPGADRSPGAPGPSQHSYPGALPLTRPSCALAESDRPSGNADLWPSAASATTAT